MHAVPIIVGLMRHRHTLKNLMSTLPRKEYGHTDGW